MVTIGGVAYRVDGLVTGVVGMEGFVAITTARGVYIVRLANRRIDRFDVQECIDMKWTQDGLYYLQSSGQVGMLQRQTTFIPTLNTFTQLTLPTPSPPFSQNS